MQPERTSFGKVSLYFSQTSLRDREPATMLFFRQGLWIED